MNTSNMKNIVILKDLPSNLVEEAIIFLKENQKLKKLETIDLDIKSSANNANQKGEKQKNTKDYIVNEAQMLVADYINKIENKNKKEDISYRKLKKRYKLLKRLSIGLSIALLLCACALIWGRFLFT